MASHALRKLGNKIVRFAVEKLGLGLGGVEVLEVVGRATGQPHRVPVNPLNYEGHTWLLSPRSETSWVKNLRAAGEATLICKRSSRPLRLAEIPVEERLPIIGAYLQRWDMQVKGIMGVDRHATDEQLAEVAGRTPVFRDVVASRSFGSGA